MLSYQLIPLALAELDGCPGSHVSTIHDPKTFGEGVLLQYLVSELLSNILLLFLVARCGERETSGLNIQKVSHNDCIPPLIKQLHQKHP